MAVGSAVALTLWLLLTWLLALFVRSSGSFGSVYGPLTAIMALLLWALLSGVALLLGIAFAAQSRPCVQEWTGGPRMTPSGSWSPR